MARRRRGVAARTFSGWRRLRRQRRISWVGLVRKVEGGAGRDSTHAWALEPDGWVLAPVQLLFGCSGLRAPHAADRHRVSSTSLSPRMRATALACIPSALLRHFGPSHLGSSGSLREPLHSLRRLSQLSLKLPLGGPTGLSCPLPSSALVSQGSNFDEYRRRRSEIRIPA